MKIDEAIAMLEAHGGSAKKIGVDYSVNYGGDKSIMTADKLIAWVCECRRQEIRYEIQNEYPREGELTNDRKAYICALKKEYESLGPADDFTKDFDFLLNMKTE